MARFWKLLLVLNTFAVFTVFFSNNLVYADEFSLGVIVDPSYTQTSRQEFINGFQLAVDQSPDISHPEGQEGGDHLGGIDVNIIIPDVSSTGENLVSQASQTANITDIIIADLQLDSLTSVYRLITGSNTYLLSLLNNQGVDTNGSNYFYGVSPTQDTSSLLMDRSAPFQEEYARKYGLNPSPYAQRGYIAGRFQAQLTPAVRPWGECPHQGLLLKV